MQGDRFALGQVQWKLPGQDSRENEKSYKLCISSCDFGRFVRAEQRCTVLDGCLWLLYDGPFDGSLRSLIEQNFADEKQIG